MFYLLILTMDDILFDFPNFRLSNNELEPELSLASNSNKDKEEEEDKWYNMPSDSNSNLNDGAPSAPPLFSQGVVLLVYLLLELILPFARSILLGLELRHLLY